MAMSAYTPIRGALNGQTAAIDGRWRLVDGYIGGVRVPEAELAGLTLTISNGTFTLSTTEGFILVDSDPQPGLMDIVATSGPNRGRFVPGIYECAADVLRICCDLSGVDRPTHFDAPPGTRRFAALYRRAALRLSEG